MILVGVIYFIEYYIILLIIWGGWMIRHVVKYLSPFYILLTNYRPISILPVISKVYEKVFYNRLYNYFSVNNLLSSSQFGFRYGASTKHALLKFSDDILKLFDQ